MEKRVFSLSSVEERRFVIGYLVLLGPILGFLLWVTYHFHIRPGLYGAAVTIGALCVTCAVRYWSNRTRKLEVSEQGLVLRSWLRKPVIIDWNMVSSVKRGYEVLSFSLNKKFLSALIRDVSGQQIAIPGTSHNSAEIIDILKQRLPESVFQAR